MKQDVAGTAARVRRILPGLLRLLVLVAILGGLMGLIYWFWLQGRQERESEEGRAASVKTAPRRVKLPGSNEAAIRFDAATQRRMGIAAASVKRVRWQKTLTMLGFSVVVPHRAAEVRSPWTGVFYAPPGGAAPGVGQRVEKAQLLGVLSVQWSPADRIQLENQLREVRGTVGETEAEIQVAREAVTRLRQVSVGAVAQKQLIEVEGNLAKLEARLKAAVARDKALEEVLKRSETAAQFPFAAPQAGQLTALHRRPGEVLSAGDLVATIYDPSEIWVAAAALPGQFESAAPPPEAEIRFPGFESQPLKARLVQVNPQGERQQQARQFVYAASNPNGRIAVGLQAEVRAMAAPAEDVVAVPRSAVLQRDGRRLVYVQRGAEDFVQQTVEVVDEDADQVYLRPTLPVGAKVVTQGAQVLLSEEYKESIQLIEEGGPSDKNEPGAKDEK